MLLKTAGWAIVAVSVAVQPAASVTVTVYGPGTRLLTTAVEAPLLQEKVGEDVPIGVAVAIPSPRPEQVTSVAATDTPSEEQSATVAQVENSDVLLPFEVAVTTTTSEGCKELEVISQAPVAVAVVLPIKLLP